MNSMDSYFEDYSFNPFSNSKINVGIGNTLISITLFGVGPSAVAYAALKVLEENNDVKHIIPFSNPATLPITAFVLNRVFNTSILGCIVAGGVYCCFKFLKGTSSPADLSTSFKNLMVNVSYYVDQFIQKTRYTMENQGSIVVYRVYLPKDIGRNQTRITWSYSEYSLSDNSFCVYIQNSPVSFSRYVECPVSFAVDFSRVLVSLERENQGNVLVLRIPTQPSTTVLLNIH